MNYKRRCAVLLVLLVQAWEAKAFFDAPVLNPAAPLEGDEVSIDIRAGECHFFSGDPRDGLVTTNGNQITILVPALFNPFCTYPTRTRPYVVGTFPSGDYTLDVYYRLAPGSGSSTPQFMGQLSFRVGPQGTPTETPIPALSTLSSFLLAMASAIAAASNLKKTAARLHS
jgi:hypothetical protein